MVWAGRLLVGLTKMAEGWQLRVSFSFFAFLHLFDTSNQPAQSINPRSSVTAYYLLSYVVDLSLNVW